MAYVCELGAGRKLFLDNDNGQTTVTISSITPGQQQQASSSFQTGVWKTIPEVYLTADGAVVKLQAAHGVHYIRVQGNSIGVSEALSLDHLYQMQMQQVAAKQGATMQPMQPMEPMQPMKPMEPLGGSLSAEPKPSLVLDDMQMTMNPMQMRMGNMEMKLGNPPTIGTMPITRRFCSQCGARVKPDDRFCSSCGHGLGE
jgi:zinc-ribbon domain